MCTWEIVKKCSFKQKHYLRAQSNLHKGGCCGELDIFISKQILSCQKQFIDCIWYPRAFFFFLNLYRINIQILQGLKKIL